MTKKPLYRLTVALLILFVIASQPAAATTISRYDSDSELANGSFTNTTVVGSGTSAYVDFNSTVFDYADGSRTHWHFDETSGSTAHDNDTDDGQQDGSLKNGVKQGADLIAGNAYEFDGGNDIVEVDNQTYGSGDNWTMAVWARVNDSSKDDQLILGLPGASGTAGIGYNKYGSGWGAGIYDGSHNHISSAAGSTYPKFLVARYNAQNNTLQLWINASYIGSVQAKDPSDYGSSANSGIGGNARFDTDYFSGVIDEPRTYKSLLSQNDIQHLYNKATGYAHRVRSGRYVGPNHSVSATSATLNFDRLSNVSATIRAEYYDGSSWKIGKSATVSSTGNHSFSLSTSADKWRWNVSYPDADYQASAHLDWVQMSQETTTVAGYVEDQDGNAIDGATVEAINSTTGNIYDSTTTNASGGYSLVLKQPASYYISTYLSGYEEGNRSVDVGSNAILDNNYSLGYTTPSVDNSSASPDGVFQTTPELSIDVEDQGFGAPQSESVTVDFYVDGSKVGSDTLSANGTAKYQSSITEGGNHTWYVVADDGTTVQRSDTFTFKIKNDLYIRNETDPDSLVNNNVNLTVKMFSEDGTTIIERTTSNGKVNLTGLPADQRILITADADGYFERRVIIKGVVEQQSMFLLNDSVTAVSNDFSIKDLTGKYPSDDSIILIQRALNTSGGSNLSWMNVAGGFFGAVNQFPATLEYRGRYRIIVENGAGDQRVVGTYIPSSSGAQTIYIGEIRLDIPNETGYNTDTDWVPLSNTSARIEFKYSDPVENTTDLEIRIHEWQNASNQILYHHTSGPVGNVTIMETINGSENVSTRWVVNWSATRNGESIGGIKQVRAKDIPHWLKDLPFPDNFAALAIYVALTFIALIFSGSHSELGALVVAAFALIFAWVGWLKIGVGLLVLTTLLAAGGMIAEGRRQRV